MQVFNFNRLSKGRAILLKDIANYIKQTTFITIGKYSEWTDETNPPPVTEFTAKEEIIIYKRPRLIMLASQTNCGGISCGNKIIDNNNYYLSISISKFLVLCLVGLFPSQLIIIIIII